MTSLAFAFVEPQIWNHIPIEDPRAARVYDRHYSRQTIGADGLVAPGQRFLLWHEGLKGAAIWAVVRNYFRGQWRWRNSIFRNESGDLSSDLIRAATITTYQLWDRRYGLPVGEELVTEIDIEATHSRRSKKHRPGHCYSMAGWEFVRTQPRSHGRAEKAIFRAPPPELVLR